MMASSPSLPESRLLPLPSSVSSSLVDGEHTTSSSPPPPRRDPGNNKSKEQKLAVGAAAAVAAAHAAFSLGRERREFEAQSEGRIRDQCLRRCESVLDRLSAMHQVIMMMMVIMMIRCLLIENLCFQPCVFLATS
jgi:hypothetical protein